MALEQETAYYDAHKADLLEHHQGRFVLIHHDQLLGG
jgi:hypothetical protein